MDVISVRRSTPAARFRQPLAVVLGAMLLAGCTSLDVGRPFASSELTEVAPPPPLVQSWRIDADAAFGPDAALALADGRVVLGTRDGVVIVLDAQDGKRVATGDFGDSVEGRVGTSGPMVFIPLASGRAGLVGYDATRPSHRWTLREGPHMAGPLVMGETLVAGAHDGTIRGLDPLTGTVRWSARPDTTAQIRAAPVAAAGLAVVIDTEGVIHAFDPDSGALAWTASAGAPVYRTPAVSGDLLVVPTTRGRLVTFDATTGAERWAIQIDPLARWSSPSADAGTVYAGATDGVLRALDPATGEERWTCTFDGTIGAAPLAAGSVVYVGTYGRRIVALDAATGDELWSEELSGRVKAGLTATDGTLVVLAEPRFVYGFRPQGIASR